MTPILCPVCTTPYHGEHPSKETEAVCTSCETLYYIIKTNGIWIANLQKKFKSIPAIYIDLDGTLAQYKGWKGIQHIGDPVVMMMRRLFIYLDEGYVVKIFTARSNHPDAVPYIKEWLKQFGLEDLEVTNIKGFDMVKLYDDRAVAVKPNEGPEQLFSTEG
jgi:hypothetical protein